MKSSKYYIFWVCVCSLSYPACEVTVPYYTVICGLSGSTTLFFYIISWSSRFSGKVSEQNVCFLSFSTTFGVLSEFFYNLWCAFCVFLQPLVCFLRFSTTFGVLSEFFYNLWCAFWVSLQPLVCFLRFSTTFGVLSEFFYNLCLTHFSLSAESSEVLINVHRSSHKVPVIFVTS